jgi:hypothetical protein
LKEIGEKYAIKKTVKEAEKDLLAKLWALQENGCTALGPALLLSILIAVCKWKERRGGKKRREEEEGRRRANSGP